MRHTTARKNPRIKYLNKVDKGIKEAAKKWGANLDAKLEFSGKNKFERKKSTRFDNRPIAAKTKNNYEICVRPLWRFCVVKGDYESLLALLSPRPENPPSIHVETLDTFLRFKRQTAGIDLLTFNSRAICKDTFGALMAVEGAWNDPKIAAILIAGVHDLHIACNHVAEYQEPCDDCCALPTKYRYKGCSKHIDTPLGWSYFTHDLQDLRRAAQEG
jgi:hypothetical protein